jgi:hypothetical protein
MSAITFVVSLQMWRLSLFGQQSPAVPYLRSCSAEEMKSASLTSAMLHPILKPIGLMAIVSRFDLTALHTMASYAAADCPFRQDAHH